MPATACTVIPPLLVIEWLTHVVEELDGKAGSRADHRAALRGDCERCVGLCCVAPPFAASADFALDKAAGVACPNLGSDFRCGIHDRLAAQGFPGCVAYDCFGAGQHVTQVTFACQDWRAAPDLAAQMFDVFAVMRDLHELLWYLSESLTMRPVRPIRGELQLALEEVEALISQDPVTLLGVDRAALRRRAGDLLLRASELARGQTPPRRDLTGKDLLGKDLRCRDLRKALLLGACLIGADLRGADLEGADLRGADLRGADLSGASLAGAIFVVQAQVEAARGDRRTRLPASVSRPARWSHRRR